MFKTLTPFIALAGLAGFSLQMAPAAPRSAIAPVTQAPPAAPVAAASAVAPAAAPATTPAAPPAATAAAILDDMADRLAACKTYRDTGVCTVEINGEVVSQRTFRTAFERPYEFVFQFGGGQPDAKDGHGFIWTAGPDVLTRGSSDGDRAAKARTLADSINQTLPHLEGAVPGLLMPGFAPPGELRSVTRATLTGEDNIGDKSCYVIHWPGYAPGNDSTLWVEKSTHLPLRLVETSSGTKFGCDQVWTLQYNPEIDVAIPAADLALPASD